MLQRGRPTRQAALFLILAFAISWICWLPVAAADHRLFGLLPSTSASLLEILGTFGPFLAAGAIVSRSSGGRGLRQFLGQAIRWRAGLQWYAAALLAPFAIRLLVIQLHVWKGGTYPGLLNGTSWLYLPETFLVVLLIGGPTGEEFGWRGFLLQRVQPLIGQVGASLVIGVIAALWHIPLFFIAGSAQSHLPYVLFAVRTVSLSIISTWLYNGSRRSLLFVLLFHASLNTWPNTVFLVETDGSLGPYISSTIIYTGWACQLFLMGLLRGRADRRQKPEPAPSIAA